MVTMVWVVSRFRRKAPPGISSTLSPQPGGKPRKFVRTCGGIGESFAQSHPVGTQ